MADHMAAKLRLSCCYQDYCEARNRIARDPELKLRLDAYRQMHMAYQGKLINQQQPGLDEEKQISNLYWSLMLNPDAKTYLENEKKLVDLIDTLYNKIGNACDIEMFTEPI